MGRFGASATIHAIRCIAACAEIDTGRVHGCEAQCTGPRGVGYLFARPPRNLSTGGFFLKPVPGTTRGCAVQYQQSTPRRKTGMTADNFEETLKAFQERSP